MLLRFYIKPSRMSEFGDLLYKWIYRDKPNYRFHLALGGAALFSEARRSILALYEASTSFAPNASTALARIIEPRLSKDITLLSKEIAKSIEYKQISLAAPPARSLTRIVKRQDNPFLRVESVTSNVVQEGEESATVELEDLQKNTEEIAKRREYLVAYAGIVKSLIVRVSGKSMKMYGSVGEKKSRKTLLSSQDCEEDRMKMKRTRGLFLMDKTLRSGGVFFKPALLLFAKHGLGRGIKDIYALKKPTIHLLEYLVYFRVGHEHETVSTSSIALGDYFIACKSGQKGSSVSIDSKEKGAVLFDYLITKVCCVLIS
jgi:hypothetical protein